MPISEVGTPGWFLSELFGDVPDDSRIVIWNRSRIAWCASADQAEATARSCEAESREAYFGACLQDANAEAPGRRGSNASARVLGGLWLDVDVAGPGHKKPRLPPDEPSALGLIDALPLKPSVVLRTGGGFHAWWFLKEPFTMQTEADRARAAKVCEAWQALAHAGAASRGWKIDSTHDLAHVMRLPGIKSAKRSVVVSLERHVDLRYDIGDFEDWSTVVGAGPRSSAEPVEAAVVGAGIVLAPSANPPVEKFNVLVQMHPNFKSTWERRRKMPGGESASEYDLALASIAAGYGWGDQEIADLLIASRRLHGDDLKLRVDYYERTIKRARARRTEDESFERLREQTEQGATNGNCGGEVLEDVSRQLGFRVIRILKFRSDPPTYRLVMDEGAIDLGSIESITSAVTFRNRIADVTRRLIPRFKNQRWDAIAQALLMSCEEQDLGSESDQPTSVGELLREYLQSHRPAEDRDRDMACSAKIPFLYESTIAVHPTPLRVWLNSQEAEKISRRDLARRLRIAGCQPRTVGYRRPDGQQTTCCVWLIPRPATAEATGGMMPEDAPGDAQE